MSNTAPTQRPSLRHIGGDKRDAIMGAALDLFVERGFYGTTVPEIAERAHVGAGTIYRYFESKEALVNELYRREKQAFAQGVIENFAVPKGGARDLFRTLWTKMAKYATDHTKSFAFLELHHHAQYLDNESRAVEQRMLALFENVIVAAQVRGELKPARPRLLMALVMGAFIGVIRNCVELDEKLTDTAWATAETCMWEAIRA